MQVIDLNQFFIMRRCRKDGFARLDLRQYGARQTVNSNRGKRIGCTGRDSA
jgi:hypothetical protein